MKNQQRHERKKEAEQSFGYDDVSPAPAKKGFAAKTKVDRNKGQDQRQDEKQLFPRAGIAAAELSARNTEQGQDRTRRIV